MVQPTLRGATGPDLRGRAEQLLRKTRSDIETMSTRDVQELVHELQVHQIELQMQNEALLQAHVEIETSHQKYQELYDFAPVGYLTLGRDDFILQANIMAGNLLRVSPEDLIGKKLSQFIKTDSQDILYMHNRAVFRSGERQTCNLEVEGDEPVHLHVNSHVLANDPERCGAVLSDITVMKKLEARLTELHSVAQSASIAKTQFLANMSHEIRTPLNAIIGLGNILSNTNLDNRQEKFLSTLRMSADSLLILVNDLLDFAKVESSTVEHEKRPFNLHQLLDEALQISIVNADKKGLELLLECDSSVPSALVGDAYRIRQVVLNLLSNAIKFTSEGFVTIQVSGEAAAQNSFVLEVMVIDTGIGIPKNKRNQIFETFTQADASITRKFGGTGLGLSISKKLIEGMGGEIGVTSEIGEGSVFHFKLPLSIDASTEKVAEYEITSQDKNIAKSGCILLVEDNSANIVVATTYLEDFGYNYEVATNGYEAIEKFKSKKFDLILMDVQMPGIDGFETTVQIRAIEQEFGMIPLPIIAMTAHILEEDCDRCKKAGINDHTPKPFNARKLQKQIKQFIQ